MPHVVLEGNFNARVFGSRFDPIKEEKPEWLIKIDEMYVESRGKRALMLTVVAEEGHAQTFYIRVSVNEGSGRFTVRLDPFTDPIKTRGVKRAIALVAETIAHRSAGTGILRHNLEGFLSLSSELTDSTSTDR